MYLIISSNKTSHLVKNRLIKDFKLTNADIIQPKLYNLVLNSANINNIPNIITNYNFILLSSLNIIDLTKQYITSNDNWQVQYFVMGLNSYHQLRQYTNNSIYYPKLTGGYQALIDELFVTGQLIIPQNQKLLILSSDNSIHQTMLHQLQPYFIHIDFLSLYNIVYNFGLLDDYLDKITHIVIHSSGVIKDLIAYLQLNMPNYQQKLYFITYHSKINQILQLEYNIQQVISY
jgi:hypothetical protein